MGIHGIYKEIGPGQRVSLAKFAAEYYETHDRPLRLAIDTSIWLFQIQAGKGGTNPALRTFYYRLLRLLSLSIHPLFVFDGPNKPPMKRNKKTAPPGAKVSSIPEFLAKQLLKQFGFPMHLAPGEAEAECALLQREGLVDAVLSEDVDTLMFGAGKTIRNWSPEGNSSKIPTHVTVYDAENIKAEYSLDRDGMVLVAMMSGGDYIPEGIPGCGPKLAVEAAKAGFGTSLCKIKRKDAGALTAWKEKLQSELRTNESKYFKRKHTTLAFPDDWPNPEILGYYTKPAISSCEKVALMKKSLRWDTDIDLPALRSFTADAFDWQKLGGAKKFIRNLAPALLMRQLRIRYEKKKTAGNDVTSLAEEEDELIVEVHGKRNHYTTDHTTELRISFSPIKLVPLDLTQEEPDDSPPEPDSDDEPLGMANNEAEQGVPSSPRKRGPSNYDPTQLDKLWVIEMFLKLGVPLKIEDWEESMRQPAFMRKRKEPKNPRSKRKSRTLNAGHKTRTQSNTIDNYAKVTKVSGHQPQSKCQAKDAECIYTELEADSARPVLRPIPSPNKSPLATTTISLLSSPILPEKQLFASDRNISEEDIPSTVTKRHRRTGLKRFQTAPTSTIFQTTLISSPVRPNNLSNFQPANDVHSPFPTSPKKRVNRRSLSSSEKIVTRKQGVLAQSTAFALTHQLFQPQGADWGGSETTVECLDLTYSSPAKAQPPSTITEWIRRSQSVTPRKADQVRFEAYRQGNASPSRGNNRGAELETVVKVKADTPNSLSRGRGVGILECLDLTASSPQTMSPSREGKFQSSMNLSQKRLARTFVRDTRLSLTLEGVTNSDARDCWSAVTLQHQLLPSSPPEKLKLPPTKRKAKQSYRIRESLEGTWDFGDLPGEKVVESGTSEYKCRKTQADKIRVAPQLEGRRRDFRASEVHVLDMTRD